jgi:tetratricopeptide (TPR) repeat protein
MNYSQTNINQPYMNIIQNTVINKISIGWTSLFMFILTSVPTSAQTIDRIRDILEKTTVQINTNANPGGSGVIIKKEGNTYTVLTANHVVCENLGIETIRCRTDFTYSIRTYDGREYPIKKRQILQTKLQDPDLAIVTFESQQNYKTASLGNSSQVKIQSDIFVAGFPTIFGFTGRDRTFSITNGKVVAFISQQKAPKGYGLIYDATTRIGNSGGPVFDSNGSVIGIHGLADADALENNNTNQSETRNNLRPNLSTIRKLINPQTESGASFQVKTGFNAGIPIDILYGVLPQTYFNTRSITSPSDSMNSGESGTSNENINDTIKSQSIAYFDKAAEQYNRGDKQGAIANYNQAIKLDPNYTDAYINRGLARSELGDNQGAIADYNQAIKLNPNYALAYYNRGIARSELGDNQGAIADYNQAIKLDPNYTDAYYNRGIVRNELGDKQGAIANYNQAIKLNPNYTNAYINRGLARSELGDNQGAIADYNQAIKLNPNYALAYYNRGIVRSELGDNQGAIADYNQAIKLDPNYTDAYYNRGIVRNELGDKQGAIANYNQAIKLNPNYTDAYINRGLARSELGDNQGAIADYNQAIKLNPNYALAYYNRGIVHSELGNNQGAIADYNQAIKLDPNYANAYYNRGIVRSALGDKQRAIADFQKAVNIYQQQGKENNYRDALDRIREIQQR